MIPVKPKDATWTDEQWQAIYQDGSNMIVSAGAGSGKTAVLTERIIEKLKRGVSISSLVVLTFTKAAAFEMKARVRSKLKKEIEKGNKDLEKELERLDSASITTFDSYSLALVKKYHYLLGIEKNIEIADNVVLGRKKREFMDEVFASFYERNEPSFIHLLDMFTTKDDENIKEVCLTLSESLEQLVHKKEYLETYLKKHYNPLFIEEKIRKYELFLEEEKNQISRIVTILKEIVSHPKSIEFIEKVSYNMEDLFSCQHYDEYKTFLSQYHPLSFLRSKKIDESELEEMRKNYNQIKEHIDKLKGLCTYKNRKELYSSIMKTEDTVSILIAILKEYDEKLFSYKKRENRYEFSDISRLAILLLETHPEISEKMKQEISEIMIDEYQDTNDIGDYFISLISNHNVYMVGDIKQSIYRFRNANPSIFMDKYNRYSKHQDGEKIDLNKNFRSRKEVLEDVNFLFEKIMDEEFGGADYEHGHAMVFGNDSYEIGGKTKQNYHFEILDYEYKDTQYSKMYRKEEIEAFLIASDIKKRVTSHEQVYDKDRKVLRDICYKDFSILLDRKTSFDLYKKIFTYLEIPLTIHKDEAFVYSDEMFVVKNMMQWISCLLHGDDTNLRYAVMSIGRSFLSDASDEELFVLFLNHKEDWYSYLNSEDCPLYEIQQKMLYLADFSKIHTLSQLLEEAYITFDMYHQILKLQDIQRLSIKLDYLLDVTRNLEKMGYQIDDFIDYLTEAGSGDVDVTFQMNHDTNQNSVNLMTIHKSKGLEYHICYYASLQKEFSKNEIKEKFLFHSSLGIVVPYFEEGIRETFYKFLLKEEYQKEDISERIRVFYVALTRAKEKMIMVTNLEDVQKESEHGGIVSSYIRKRYRSFYDILVSIISDLKPYRKKVLLEDISLTKAYNQIKESNYQKLLSKSEFKSNYIHLSIQKKSFLERHFSESYHVIDKEEKKRLELGLKLHECLEYIDYNHMEESLAHMNLSSFEVKKLSAFFHQPFFKNFINPEFFPEFEFIEVIEDEEFHGIIDLLIVSEDTVYVIDYKLKYTEKESYERQVKGYMKVIQNRLQKPVVGILYSIFDETYHEIKM